MKEINSNIGTWILSAIGALAIALSIVVSLPTISKANEPAGCTADCGGGRTVTCNGPECSAVDGSGCTWSDSTGTHGKSC